MNKSRVAVDQIPNYHRSYKGYDIVVKRDFGSQFFLIDGMPCMWGYVVVIGKDKPFAGCNAMPGATWFQTVKDAIEAIDVLEITGDCAEFWPAYRARAARSAELLKSLVESLPCPDTLRSALEAGSREYAEKWRESLNKGAERRDFYDNSVFLSVAASLAVQALTQCRGGK